MGRTFRSSKSYHRFCPTCYTKKEHSNSIISKVQLVILDDDDDNDDYLDKGRVMATPHATIMVADGKERIVSGLAIIFVTLVGHVG